MILEKDSTFLEKQKSVIQHMEEGNHMFYSSMQELLKYVSTQFLRYYDIMDTYLKEKRKKILNSGGSAIETIKTVCMAIKQPSLYDSINMSLMNILANSSKHSTLVFPYSEQYGEDIISVYNDYVAMMMSCLQTNNIFTENCFIDFTSVKTDSQNKESKPIIQSNSIVDKYINGEVGNLAIQATNDTLSDEDKFKLMQHLADKFDKEYEGSKHIFQMGGNDWFVCFKDGSGVRITIALIRQFTDYNNAVIYHDGTRLNENMTIGVSKSVTFTTAYRDEEGKIYARNSSGNILKGSKFIRFTTYHNTLDSITTDIHK